MKQNWTYKNKVKLLFFIGIFLNIMTTFIVECKSNLKKKNLLHTKSKINQVIVSSLNYGQIGSNSNFGVSKEAVAYGSAGEFSKIPDNHPITQLKPPRYVEKLKYYEDIPAKEREQEAVSLGTNTGEDYYHPFSGNQLIFEAKKSYNCESIVSPFVCQESSLCAWDNSLKACFISRQISHPIRFKERNMRVKHMRRRRHHKH